MNSADFHPCAHPTAQPAVAANAFYYLSFPNRTLYPNFIYLRKTFLYLPGLKLQTTADQELGW
uniref:Uncharacterized protein n=1 Tax=mine drainage metagenome TaxID=410659 RepID=E6QLQ1_9ZZZZ